MNKNDCIDFSIINDFCNSYAGFDKLEKTKISSIFRSQYYQLYQQGIWDILAIKEAIWDIENDRFGNQGMKADEQFSNEPLKGLWKKHWFDLNFAMKNEKNEISNPQSSTMKQIVHLLNEKGRMEPIEIANTLFLSSLNNRTSENRYTGEWIVYARKKTDKWILSFANHKEGNNRIEGDTMIFKRIKDNCFSEFTDLFKDDEYKEIVP